MPLFLYNTLSREKELFVPLDTSHVRLYVCGPTVYDHVHIGNGRPVVVFDVLYRLLRRRYARVTYARNITDIDDKIMERARINGESIEALTGRTSDDFRQVCAALGALPPDIEPRATAHVDAMIDMIARLIERNHAYVAEGHVLFSVPSMPDYGALSRRSRDELVAGARVDVAPYKRDAADFVLWKPSGDGQAGWDSPWGRGRPGWHIECSAMSRQHLGETFDIHGGGLDLIFPHHENEIAQSRCAHGSALMARVWMHNGFLNAHGDKMSKSLGNFFTIHELLQDYPGEAIRLLLLSAQYRQPLDFTKEGLSSARQQLDRLYGALRSVPEAGAADPVEVPAEVDAALEDDLNTPLALSHLHELAGILNRAASDRERQAAAMALRAGGAVLGLLQRDAEDWFKTAAPARVSVSEAEIEAAIAARQAARSQRNFAEADRIRAELLSRGVALDDAAKATTWRRV